MNWQLILEFTKALASPITTVVSLVLVTRLAASKYRAEKVIERRLQWFDAALAKLGEASEIFGRLEGALRAGRQDIAPQLRMEAERQISILGSHFEQAIMYIPQSSIDVIQKAMTEMTELQIKTYSPQGTTPDIIRDMAMACMVAASRIGEDARRELGIPQLRWNDRGR